MIMKDMKPHISSHSLGTTSVVMGVDGMSNILMVWHHSAYRMRTIMNFKLELNIITLSSQFFDTKGSLFYGDMRHAN